MQFIIKQYCTNLCDNLFGFNCINQYLFFFFRIHSLTTNRSFVHLAIYREIKIMLKAIKSLIIQSNYFPSFSLSLSFTLGS